MAYTFRDIKVWQKAHELVLEIYKVTKRFPIEEKYGLTAQLRRSAASVATNIVEGHTYVGKGDYGRLSVLADEVGRMLYGFQKTLSGA
ncbi:MAG: four helix bundle protein [Chlamydiota bacterium]